MQILASHKRRSRLTAEDVTAILPYGARSTWPPNFQIYQQGTPADGVSVVLRGHVILRNRTRAGRGFVPAIVTPGETFGVEGVTRDGIYVTDSHAAEDTETLFLSSAQFRAFVREKPTAAIQVLGQMMGERSQLLEKLNALASQNVEQRLIGALERLARDRSFIGDDGKLRLELKHHRLLCEMVGATRESIALALGKLVGSGTAERRGMAFLIAPSGLNAHISRDGLDNGASFGVSRESVVL
ncbi:MAG TPA: Crp/Fnr family transcriptional regulator [Gemmatimonadaceae bacterium]|nr:Crp/Fnr family transcriptional regulator [Gemmatimonadaceae bacterium]